MSGYKLIVMEWDGNMIYAVGGHAEQVGKYIDGAQTIAGLHGAPYTGRPMVKGSWADLPESERARIHALTRKVTMSDEELRRLYEQDCIARGIRPNHEAFDFACDLRDRYEERGPHAPVAPEAK